MEKADRLKDLKTGAAERPLIISGPCSAESEEQVMQTALALKPHQIDIYRAGIWKPRTMPGTFEGMGEVALPWLAEVRKQLGIRTGTEVATPYHIEKALGAGIDVLWIGARTTTNPFAVQEVAQALKGTSVPVFVKNPVNPDLELWIGAVERLKRADVNVVGAIHRGFSTFTETKYRNIPYWSIPIEFRRRMPDIPLICDPSHISGKRELIEEIALHAMNLNFDGLFIESHIHPEAALSDSRQQITPERLGEILAGLAPLSENSSDALLRSFRDEIDAIDEQIYTLIAKRMKISSSIGKYKSEHSISIFQQERYEQIIRERVEFGCSTGLDREFVERLVREIHEESVRIQMDLIR